MAMQTFGQVDAHAVQPVQYSFDASVGMAGSPSLNRIQDGLDIVHGFFLFGSHQLLCSGIVAGKILLWHQAMLPPPLQFKLFQ